MAGFNKGPGNSGGKGSGMGGGRSSGGARPPARAPRAGGAAPGAGPRTARPARPAAGASPKRYARAAGETEGGFKPTYGDKKPGARTGSYSDKKFDDKKFGGRSPAAGRRFDGPPRARFGETVSRQIEAAVPQAVLDVVKKAFFIGLGASAASGEKLTVLAQDLSQELAKQGWLPAKEVTGFVNDLKVRASGLEPQLRQASEQAFSRMVDSLGLVRKSDLDALKAELTGVPLPDRAHNTRAVSKRPAIAAKKAAKKPAGSPKSMRAIKKTTGKKSK
ncbi:MAG: hypothetical protein VKJ06_06030 [Vampirovibrionales bacterium]|nr:hypothetical protein [Vampirovibrionales bacterium]